MRWDHAVTEPGAAGALAVGGRSIEHTRRRRPCAAPLPGRWRLPRAGALALLLLATALGGPVLAAEPLCDTDIDGNGSAEADRDGKLLVRHLFGFQGEALTEGLIGAGCTRCDAAAIASHLESTACQVLFDIDGDGARRPLTDGLLLWRQLAGYSGSALVAGALGEGASRDDPEAIRGWLSLPVLPPGDAPYQVQLVAASSLASDQIGLEWLTTSDNDTPVSQLRYVLHASTEAGFVPSDATANTELVDAAYGTLTGLSADTPYFVKVEAIDAQGNNSWSNELAARTAATSPSETSATRLVLDASNARDLTTSAETIRYTLPSGASVPTAGTIITSALGEGFLRRVTAVATTGDQVTLSTEPADLISLFDAVQLSSDTKLIDVPAPERLRSVAATGQLKMAQSPGERSIEWPERGLSISQRQWPSALDARVSATETASSTAGCDGRGSGSQTDTDAPLQLSGPEVICVEPGTAMRFDVTAALDAAEAAGYRLTGLDFDGMTHPTRAGAANFGAAFSPPAEGERARRATLAWRPGEGHVDTDGRPYSARFTATAVKRDCSVFCTRRVALEVPIYVAWGEIPFGISIRQPFSSGRTLTLSGEVGVDFQPALTVDAALRDGRVEAATVRVDGPLAFRTEVTLDASAAGNYDFEQELIEKQFRRVFMAGQVPILISGELEVTVQFRAEAEANLELTQTLDLGYDLSAGLVYTDHGGWDVIGAASPWQKYELRGEADSRAEVELRFVPDLTIRFYDALTGRLLIEPYLYGQAGLEGHFVYRGGSDGSSDDADYRFTELEFGGGIDGRLRLSLEVLNYQLAGFPSRNPDDLHDVQVIEGTPILGLPTLQPSFSMARNPAGQCAMMLNGGYENVPNPFGSDSLNPFEEASGAWQIVEPGGDEILEPSEQPMQAWFIGEEGNTYRLRFSGHSALGSFVRQYEEIEVAFDQDDEACACDEGLIAGRYQPIGEDCGIIRDVVNGLDWQRCSVGQTWDPVEQDCRGGRPGLFEWDEALTLTAPGGFRLPTISELRTLVYCSTGQPVLFGMPYDHEDCEGYYQRPTIVSEAFPLELPSSGYWSSSLYAGYAYDWWAVEFSSGFVYGRRDHYTTAYVRLVRAGP